MLRKIMAMFLFIAIVVITYISVESSNIIRDVQDGNETAYSTSIQIKRSVRVESYNVSFLVIPNGKAIKIYRGAIKKSTLDKMDHIGFSTLDFPVGTSRPVVERAIKDIAKQIGANVSAIDSHGLEFRTNHE